jgi:hypothetical protein
LFASNAFIELELSTTIAKVGLIISSVFLVIIGLINNNRIPNNDTKPKKHSILIAFGFIIILKNDKPPAITIDSRISRTVFVVILFILMMNFKWKEFNNLKFII